MSTQHEPPAETVSMQAMTQPDTDSLPIYEVARELGLAQHVMRMWESRFPQLRPLRGQGGRRYYRPHDIAVLRQIADLLYVRKLSVAQAQAELGQDTALAADPSPVIDAAPAAPVTPEVAPAYGAAGIPATPVPPVAQAQVEEPAAEDTPAPPEQPPPATMTVEQVTIIEETVGTIQVPEAAAPVHETPQDTVPVDDAPSIAAASEDAAASGDDVADEDEMPLEQIVMIELERLQGENAMLRESLRGVLVELQALREMVPV
ncbi:MerR family transcriptional regulator [Komagataeibacter intermedius]|uniref:Transcriptional regulator n=2 Tax=Komagataeibacter intermedius TaxID=66229 RepID=A0A0N1N631_9PROT|nr:MerR family transcriptional regulator [Komagataeibacter intermedius]KPH88940.1 transcriptional regulator [Komagataeibacter intermedius AF2]MCF3635006.1 MerR family transcriptional regulator [Komagataeibacter intermedius]GAN88242.1 transcriptional regulator MerR [Komagataeibacter intermedius TF2]GBQ66348.1 transcriptional regulator [Komagataeibacter intermedius NRIC 0521]